MEFELLEERANDGDVNAIRQLVECYRNGIGVEQDLEMAGKWEEMLLDVDENSEESALSRDGYWNNAPEVTKHHDDDNQDGSEKETGHNDHVQSTSPIEHSWKEIRQELEKMSFVKLNQVVARGNYLAELVAGERYLKSQTYEEQIDGAERIRNAIEHVKNGEVKAASMDAIKDALSEGWAQLADYYLKNYKYRPGFAEKAFEACSNAFEIDHSDIEGLITCYKYGIGCEKDESKISIYERYKAESGGIVEKYKYAKSLGNGSITAIEFLQKALGSYDADEHPYYKSLARLSLAKLGEKEIDGEAIDVEREKQFQNEILNANEDPDAIEINKEIADEREKQRRAVEEQRRIEEERYRTEKEERERAIQQNMQNASRGIMIGVVVVTLLCTLVFFFNLSNAFNQKKNVNELEKRKMELQKGSDDSYLKLRKQELAATSGDKAYDSSNVGSVMQEKSDVIKQFDNVCRGKIDLSSSEEIVESRFYVNTTEYKTNNYNELIGIYKIVDSYEYYTYYIFTFIPFDSNVKASSVRNSTVFGNRAEQGKDGNLIEATLHDLIKTQGGTPVQIPNV